MFKKYNEKSCLFECRLKNALRITAKSGIACIPWDYPAPYGDIKPIGKITFCYALNTSFLTSTEENITTTTPPTSRPSSEGVPNPPTPPPPPPPATVGRRKRQIARNSEEIEVITAVTVN